MAPIATSPSPAVSSLDRALVWLSSGVCSQNPAHSFWLGGHSLPLCARDLGLFGGFLLALTFAPRTRPTLLWLLGLGPLVLDGANSFATDAFGLALYEPSNPLRLATGALAGICLALALGPHMPSRRLTAAMLPFVPLLAVAPYTALALFGTLAICSLLVSANLLTQRFPTGLAYALTLPELALLATAKHAALGLLR